MFTFIEDSQTKHVTVCYDFPSGGTHDSLLFFQTYLTAHVNVAVTLAGAFQVGSLAQRTHFALCSIITLPPV